MQRQSNNKFTRSTIIITFKDEVTTKEVKNYLDTFKAFGVRVNCMLNRYAVEVFFGQEKRFIETSKESDLVRSVCDHYLKGSKITPIYPLSPKNRYSEYFGD